MPGFYFTNMNAIEPVTYEDVEYIKEKMIFEDFTIWRYTLNKFMEDKAFCETDNYVLISEGVILNKTELMNEYNAKSLHELIICMIEQKGDTFFKYLRGMFSGAVYIKKTKKWIFYTDQIGNKAIFYYNDGKNLIVGSQLCDVTETMKINSIMRAPDENGLNQFLSFGCYMDDSTGVYNVRRVLPGDFGTFCDGRLRIRTYHQFCEEVNKNISSNDAIILLDKTFRNAMKQAVEKNKEYGYTNLVDISGGADSRMIAYTVHDLSAENVLLCHYSQFGSSDWKISKRISKKLEYKSIFYKLDDAEFLRDIDITVKMNSGTAYYCGITGGRRMLQKLSDRKVGIEFTGLLGNMYDSGMLIKDGNIKPTLNVERYCFAALENIGSVNVNTLKRFNTNDMFWLYTRGMLCGMSTFLTRQNYVEPFTPYGDVEFIQAWLSIPWDKKVQNKLLLRWMNRFYPEAMRIPYAGDGLPLFIELFPFKCLVKKVKQIIDSILVKLRVTKNFGMNPFDKWENEFEWLPNMISKYYESAVDMIKEHGIINDTVINMVRDIYNSNNVMGKYIAITVLSYIKNYII